MLEYSLKNNGNNRCPKAADLHLGHRKNVFFEILIHWSLVCMFFCAQIFLAKQWSHSLQGIKFVHVFLGFCRYRDTHACGCFMKLFIVILKSQNWSKLMENHLQ